MFLHTVWVAGSSVGVGGRGVRVGGMIVGAGMAVSVGTSGTTEAVAGIGVGSISSGRAGVQPRMRPKVRIKSRRIGIIFLIIAEFRR
jgi:hypothetical protein